MAGCVCRLVWNIVFILKTREASATGGLMQEGLKDGSLSYPETPTIRLTCAWRQVLLGTALVTGSGNEFRLTFPGTGLTVEPPP